MKNVRRKEKFELRKYLARIFESSYFFSTNFLSFMKKIRGSIHFPNRNKRSIKVDLASLGCRLARYTCRAPQTSATSAGSRKPCQSLAEVTTRG